MVARSRPSPLTGVRLQVVLPGQGVVALFSRGRLVLHDRAYDWRPWLTSLLPVLTQRLRDELQVSAPPTPLPRPTPLQEAA